MMTTTTTTVRDVLQQKGDIRVFTVQSDDLVYEALRKMERHNVASLVVLDDGKLAGIITERDYARKIALERRSSRDTLVGEIMEEGVLCCSPDDTVTSLLSLMTQERVRHLPVLDEGKLVGLISMGDVVSSIINDQEFMISQLTQYISSSYGDFS